MIPWFKIVVASGQTKEEVIMRKETRNLQNLMIAKLRGEKMTKEYRFLVMVSTVVLLISIAVTSLAVSVSGSTNGGSSGKTTAYGELTYKNYTSAGRDTATAKTKSAYSGSSNWSYARLDYAYGQGSGSADKSDSSTGTTWSKATASPKSNNYHGYYAVSAHVVNTDVYGGWSDSQAVTIKKD